MELNLMSLASMPRPHPYLESFSVCVRMCTATYNIVYVGVAFFCVFPCVCVHAPLLYQLTTYKAGC